MKFIAVCTYLHYCTKKETGLKHFIDIKIQFIALYRLFFCQTFCFLMW